MTEIEEEFEREVIEMETVTETETIVICDACGAEVGDDGATFERTDKPDVDYDICTDCLKLGPGRAITEIDLDVLSFVRHDLTLYQIRRRTKQYRVLSGIALLVAIVFIVIQPSALIAAIAAGIGGISFVTGQNYARAQAFHEQLKTIPD